MNFKWEKKYLYWGVTAFCVIAASVLFTISVSNFDSVVKLFNSIIDVFTPFIYGFAFAYLLSPVMNFFEKKCFRVLFTKISEKRAKGKTVSEQEQMEKELKIKKTARVLGVVASMLFATACLVGLVSALLPQLVDTITNIINRSPEYLKKANEWVSEVLKDYPPLEEAVSDFLTNFTTYLMDFFRTGLLPQVSEIVSGVSSGIMNTIGALINVIIGFIMCIYLLYGKELFAAQGKKLLYSLLSVSGANMILRNVRQIHKTFGGFITGKIIDSLIIGFIFFIVLTVFDFPYVVLISVILGVTNVIPYFGPFIGAVPCALLILLVDPIKCLYFIIIVFIVQQFDGNVLGPFILGDNTGLSSFWVIFALILGQSIFGFVGLIISIPLFAVAYSIVKARISRRLQKKGMPADSNVYRKIGYIDRDSGETVTLEQLKIEDEKAAAEKAAGKRKKKNAQSSSIRDFIQKNKKK